MISYEVYKIIHLLGLVLLFSGLVGLLTVKMSGGKLEGSTKSLVFISHGVGLLFLLVGGFGLLARLQLAQNMPNWVYIKLIIWLAMGAALSLVKRKGHLGWPIYISLLVVFLIAAYVGVLKPI